MTVNSPIEIGGQEKVAAAPRARCRRAQRTGAARGRLYRIRDRRAARGRRDRLIRALRRVGRGSLAEPAVAGCLSARHVERRTIGGSARNDDRSAGGARRGARQRQAAEYQAIALVSAAHFVNHFQGLVLPPLFPFLKIRAGGRLCRAWSGADGGECARGHGAAAGRVSGRPARVAAHAGRGAARRRDRVRRVRAVPVLLAPAARDGAARIDQRGVSPRRLCVAVGTKFRRPGSAAPSRSIPFPGFSATPSRRSRCSRWSRMAG